MQPKLDLSEIFSILDNSPLIVKKQVITADGIAERAVYKIRCQLLIPPHFPELSSHPHHFHNRDGEVQPSKLKGVPKEDLPVVLAELVKCMF